jgi:hypothetical protein
MRRAQNLLVALAVAVSLVSGCEAGATAPPTLDSSTFSWRVADTLQKPSTEPGKVVLAVLLKGDYGAWPGPDVYFDAGFAKGAPSGSCWSWSSAGTGSPFKLLDPLHPDAVQPALSQDFHRAIIKGGHAVAPATPPPAQYGGWISWQIDPGLVSCDRQHPTFQVEADLIISSAAESHSMAIFTLDAPWTSKPSG